MDRVPVSIIFPDFFPHSRLLTGHESKDNKRFLYDSIARKNCAVGDMVAGNMFHAEMTEFCVCFVLVAREYFVEFAQTPSIGPCIIDLV